MKGQKYDFSYSSSAVKAVKAELGTIESDASGFNGCFIPEPFRGKEILDKLLTLDFETVLDIGAGECKQANFLKDSGKKVYMCDYGKGHNSMEAKQYDYVGDFNTIHFDQQFDCVVASHVLEHQLNTNVFLKRVVSVTKPDGYIVIIVPPRKPFLIGGHVSSWNAGMVIYHLILAGVDCAKECYVKQYDYNIGVIVRNVKNNIDSLDITYDGGDISNILYPFFPMKAWDGVNGDIMELNWQ